MAGKHVIYKHLRRRNRPNNELVPETEEANAPVETDCVAPAYEKQAPANAPNNSLLYPTVQMMEANEAAHPVTNALKINGQIMTTLVDTGSCVTLVRLDSFPKEAIFLERKGYDGSNIISVTGHALNVDSTAEVFFYHRANCYSSGGDISGGNYLRLRTWNGSIGKNRLFMHDV